MIRIYVHKSQSKLLSNTCTFNVTSRLMFNTHCSNEGASAGNVMLRCCIKASHTGVRQTSSIVSSLSSARTSGTAHHRRLTGRFAFCNSMDWILCHPTRQGSQLSRWSARGHNFSFHIEVGRRCSILLKVIRIMVLHKSKCLQQKHSQQTMRA